MSDKVEISAGRRLMGVLLHPLRRIHKPSGDLALQRRLTHPDPNDYQRTFDEEANRLRNLAGIKEVVSFQPQDMQLIHATGDKKTAETISNEGLYCFRGGLSGVAIPLPEDVEQSLRIIANRHKSFRYVVTINLPPLPEDAQKDIERANAEFGLAITRAALLVVTLPQNREVSGIGYGRLYNRKLPSKFIKGYFDAFTGEFIKNQNFNPKLDQQDEQNVTNKLQNLDAPDAYHRFH